MTTKPKRMLVHVCSNGQWVSHEYPSTRQMRRTLRGEGVSFGQNSTAGLGSTSVTIRNGSTILEIEEAVEFDGRLSFDGKEFLPVKEWAEKRGSTVRKARYAYLNGRLDGMTVGNRNYLYIRDDA